MSLFTGLIHSVLTVFMYFLENNPVMLSKEKQAIPGDLISYGKEVDYIARHMVLCERTKI